MAASILFGEALALGLASGPACVAACGPVLVPALLTERAGLRPNAQALSVFLGARLLGYLLFAAGAWEVGTLASLLPTHRVFMMGLVNVTLGGVLIWYAWSAKHACGEGCPERKLVNIRENRLVNIGTEKSRRASGAAVLGLLTGLSLCPPFVAAGFRAAQLGGAIEAMVFFTFFFLGTTVWFVPFAGLGCIVRNHAVMTVARMTMVLIALYYLLMGITMLMGRHGNGF